MAAGLCYKGYFDIWNYYRPKISTGHCVSILQSTGTCITHVKQSDIGIESRATRREGGQGATFLSQTMLIFNHFDLNQPNWYYVVPQYHKYRGTTVRYLPTNNHFSEDFRAKKNSLLTGWINWKSSKYRRYFGANAWCPCPMGILPSWSAAEARLMLLRCAVLCHHVSDR